MFLKYLHLFILIAFISSCASSDDEKPQTALQDANAGIFSQIQIQNGQQLFNLHCVACHGNDLRGTEGGTALMGDHFLEKWKDSTLAQLYSVTQKTMPKANPGSLDDPSYASLIAFILSANGFPSGHAKLPFEAESLRHFKLGMPPAATRVSLQFKPKALDTGKHSVEAEWLQHRGDFASTNYSPLEQINRDNVKNLKILWRWKSDNFGPGPEYYFKVTPLMVNGILYTTAGSSRSVVAIDAETGETLWVFHLDERERQPYVPRQNSGRGVAYWKAPDGQDRVLYISPAYQLVALDAKSGRPIHTFGKDGVVDLKKALDPPKDPQTPIGSTSPPIIVNDVVILGSTFPVGLAPESKRQARGDIMGFDVRTGKKLWTFHSIPQSGEPGVETWKDNSWEYTGNAGAWAPLSADPDLGYVYLPMEAATGDFYGGHRPGDNLYSSSLVCLNAKTGTLVWHYQIVHHDIWDYDLPAPPVLADLTVYGQPVKAVIQVTKQAFVFAFERTHGQPIWPIEEKPVPQSSIPGENPSPTQPFPTRPDPFDHQGYSEDILVDFTPEIKEQAKAIAAKYDKGPIYNPVALYHPPDQLGTLVIPDAVGGANWQGAVLDPETGVLYVSSSTVLRPMSLEHGDERTDMDYMAYLGSSRIGPYGLPLVKPPYGRITAIDMNAGEHLWMVANADSPDWIKNNPALKGLNIPRTGTPDRVGLLVTKTLLFAGEGSGLYVSDGGGGNKFHALDKATGEIIAEIELPANQCGIPMTYSINGKQYIVVAVGAVGHPGELVALGL